MSSSKKRTEQVTPALQTIVKVEDLVFVMGSPEYLADGQLADEWFPIIQDAALLAASTGGSIFFEGNPNTLLAVHRAVGFSDVRSTWIVVSDGRHSSDLSARTFYHLGQGQAEVTKIAVLRVNEHFLGVEMSDNLCDRIKTAYKEQGTLHRVSMLQGPASKS